LQNCCLLFPEDFHVSKISAQLCFVFMRQKKHMAMNEKRCTLPLGYRATGMLCAGDSGKITFDLRLGCLN
jgi:hypothetical protein